MKIEKNREMKNWLDDFKFNHPFVIAGPCSAETKEQVLNTAHQLKELGINIYRAGVWKPRTRPNSFEGIGSKSLEWLKQVKQETGMLIAVEVANKKHVYEALKSDIDILWIGARTSVNPFSVQEIADSLKGIDIPILVKNPINPDLELWIGAIERIQQAGITRIAAIHRGFSSYGPTKFRNTPQWQIPIELKRRMPQLPIICDPSHIGGTRELITTISQKAMDLDMDGLMIEAHCNPSEAWSDVNQQITPKYLKKILKELVRRKVKPDNVSLSDLEDLRHRIDKYDKELLTILANRMSCVIEIGNYKKKNQMTILQTDRWNEILKSGFIEGRSFSLSDEFVQSIFKSIHQESINKQELILNS